LKEISSISFANTAGILIAQNPYRLAFPEGGIKPATENF
jgi:hypothetical protein